MTEAEYDADYPELDWPKFRAALVYAIGQLDVADEKEADTLPCSAGEHRAMAFRKVRNFLKGE